MLKPLFAGGPAEFECAGLRVPSADVGLFRTWMVARMFLDAEAQLRVEFRAIGPQMLQQRAGKKASETCAGQFSRPIVAPDSDPLEWLSIW